MKTITFRPLRRIKKTGKIVVASYMQWRKVMTADYNKFNLIIDNCYKTMPLEEYIYNHEGELLFWYNYPNPNDLPKNYIDINVLLDYGIDKIWLEGEEWKLTEPLGKGFHYSIPGFDCDGIPVFSHYTQDDISTHYEDVSVFEPLTVSTVVKWFGWFLLQLENSYLKIGK